MDTKLGLTLARSREIDRMAYAMRDEVSFSTLGIPDGSTTRGLYLVPYQKNRKGSARGSIQYTWDRSTSVLNRFLHRTVKALTPERDQKIRAAVGALGGYVERTAVMNSAMGASSGLKPFLPKRVVKAA